MLIRALTQSPFFYSPPRKCEWALLIQSYSIVNRTFRQPDLGTFLLRGLKLTLYASICWIGSRSRKRKNEYKPRWRFRIAKPQLKRKQFDKNLREPLGCTQHSPYLLWTNGLNCIVPTQLRQTQKSGFFSTLSQSCRGWHSGACLNECRCTIQHCSMKV